MRAQDFLSDSEEASFFSEGGCRGRRVAPNCDLCKGLCCNGNHTETPPRACKNSGAGARIMWKTDASQGTRKKTEGKRGKLDSAARKGWVFSHDAAAERPLAPSGMSSCPCLSPPHGRGGGRRGEAAPIFSPGAKAEPPYEASIVHSLFSYEGGRDRTCFFLQISSLSASWVLAKRMDEVITLVQTMKRKKGSSGALRRVRTADFVSLAPEKREGRAGLIELVLTTLLNHVPNEPEVQTFVLTDAVDLGNSVKCDPHTLRALVRKYTSYFVPEHRRDGVFLTEYRGFFRGWKCSFFQLQNGALIRSSARSGEIREIIPLGKYDVCKYNPLMHKGRGGHCLHALLLKEKEGKRFRILCTSNDEERDFWVQRISGVGA